MKSRNWMCMCLAVSAIGSVTGHAVAKPLKIALIESLSGPQAPTGKLYENGSRFAVDKLNLEGGFNGEPIELLVLDNAGSASTASERFKEAQAAGAQIVVQAASSAIAGQLSEDVRKHNLRNPTRRMLFINVGAEASELTGAKCHYYSFRLASSVAMRANALLKAMKDAKALGERVYSINQNYALGQEMEAAVVANAGRLGYEVVGRSLHDIGRIQDFAPFAAKIAQAKPSAIITANWSSDLLLLVKATSEASIKVPYGGTYLDQQGNVGSAGDLLLGSYLSGVYNIEADRTGMPEAFKTRFGRFPVSTEAHVYYMHRYLLSALRKVESRDAELDAKQAAEALENTRFQTPLGEISIRKDDHQAVLPLTVSKASQNVRYPLDGTRIGFEIVAVVPGTEAIYPPQDSCRMQPN